MSKTEKTISWDRASVWIMNRFWELVETKHPHLISEHNVEIKAVTEGIISVSGANPSGAELAEAVLTTAFNEFSEKFGFDPRLGKVSSRSDINQDQSFADEMEDLMNMILGMPPHPGGESTLKFKKGKETSGMRVAKILSGAKILESYSVKPKSGVTAKTTEIIERITGEFKFTSCGDMNQLLEKTNGYVVLGQSKIPGEHGIYINIDDNGKMRYFFVGVVVAHPTPIGVFELILED